MYIVGLMEWMAVSFLPGLPICREHISVYFETSLTTIRGNNRHKAPFCFKFEVVDEAEGDWSFLAFLKNGSIALLWKEQDAKKKKDINNPTINVPLKDSTNTEWNPVRDAKRKSRSNDMVDHFTHVQKDSLNLVCLNGGIDRSNNDVENQPTFCNRMVVQMILFWNPHSVGCFQGSWVDAPKP